MDILLRIRQLALHGKLRFSRKAQDEMDVDDLTRFDIVESLINAHEIDKTLRSTSPGRRRAGEKLYVIKSPNFTGTLICTKGAIVRESGEEIYYILVSAKVAEEA